MLLPGAVAVPPVIGFGIGAEALGGALGGALLGCVLMALTMANAGGAWDNAKKFVEKGNLGGKGSEVHAATVVGDTVGDPFKDTSGPSMNILINGQRSHRAAAVGVRRGENRWWQGSHQRPEGRASRLTSQFRYGAMSIPGYLALTPVMVSSVQ